ncbi:MAG: FtsX-like permease family protein [Gemmatimonadales bacterium]|nr:FtsX-like permease family protein [Gemmatimonadales bacterium]
MLVGAFALTALLLVAAGLYGVTAYGVSQRRKEIGIRLALGAVRGRVVRMVAGEAAFPLAIGTLTGLIASGWVTSLAGRLLPAAPGSSLGLIVGVTAFLALVGAAATLIPAVGASRIDPAKTLKDELA